MAGNDNIETIRRVYETFSSGDLGVLDECVAPDVVDHNPDPDQGPGLQGVKEAFVRFREAVPDLRFTVEDVFASGDKVVSRATMSGTDQGGMLPGSPPTGRSFTVDHIDIVRFEGGKAVERWGLTDVFSLMQQLGALPEMSESGAA